MTKIEDTRIWNLVLKLERFVIVLTGWLVTVLIVLGVVLRYLLNADLFGIEEILIILAFWLYFMGSAYGSYEGSHIRADIYKVFLKNPKAVKLINLLTLSISSFTSAVFTIWGFKYVLWGLQKGAKSPGWRIPQVIPQSSIFFGFLLMTVYFSVHLVRTIQNRE